MLLYDWSYQKLNYPIMNNVNEASTEYIAKLVQDEISTRRIKVLFDSKQDLIRRDAIWSRVNNNERILFLIHSTDDILFALYMKDFIHIKNDMIYSNDCQIFYIMNKKIHDVDLKTITIQVNGMKERTLMRVSECFKITDSILQFHEEFISKLHIEGGPDVPIIYQYDKLTIVQCR